MLTKTQKIRNIRSSGSREFLGISPTDGIHRTGGDRVIDIESFVGIARKHNGHPIIIHLKDSPGDGDTRPASDTGLIYMGYSSERGADSRDLGGIDGSGLRIGHGYRWS